MFSTHPIVSASVRCLAAGAEADAVETCLSSIASLSLNMLARVCLLLLLPLCVHSFRMPSTLRTRNVMSMLSERKEPRDSRHQITRLLQKSFLPAAAVATTVFGFQHAAAASGLLKAIQAQASSSGFLQAFLLIFVSEIGDKTFFIAGLLAAKYSRWVSFVGSMGALAVMTVISVVIGQLFHAVPPGLTKGVPYDDYIAVAAFAYFGAKTLYEAITSDEGEVSGIEEEEAEAEKAVEDFTAKNKVSQTTLALLAQTFSLVFAAEIGDRSFLSTIALSAALNPIAVTGGAILAHGTATGIAVAGGALLSKYLSEKVIGYIGGSLFLIFAVTTATGLF